MTPLWPSLAAVSRAGSPPCLREQRFARFGVRRLAWLKFHIIRLGLTDVIALNMSTSDFVHAGSLEELKAKGRLVVPLA